MTTPSRDAPANGLTFYPAYCHAISPTVNVWAKLTAADVHQLCARPGYEGQNIYFYLNHPIRWVRLVGVLVAFEEMDRRWIMVLDDSSGENIEVVCIKPRPGPIVEPLKREHTDEAQTRQADSGVAVAGVNGAPDMTGIDLGSVVKVKGGVGEFRGMRQIILKRISESEEHPLFIQTPDWHKLSVWVVQGVVPSTAHELQAWVELSAFYNEVLHKPWVVPEEKQRKLLQRTSGSADRRHKGRKSQKRQAAAEEGEDGESSRRPRDKKNNPPEKHSRSAVQYTETAQKNDKPKPAPSTSNTRSRREAEPQDNSLSETRFIHDAPRLDTQDGRPVPDLRKGRGSRKHARPPAPQSELEETVQSYHHPAKRSSPRPRTTTTNGKYDALGLG